MEIDTENDGPKRGKGIFDWTLNFGHVFVALSIFFSAAGLYAHDEARAATQSTQLENHTERLNYYDSQNLPPRVQALEASQADMKDSLHDIRDVLIQIRNGLDRKADKKN